GRYLIDEVGVDVIVKLNPTLLGYDEVSYLLRERMGYHELRPRQAAFHSDLPWDEALQLGRRLEECAARAGRRFGIKMTNTLLVAAKGRERGLRDAATTAGASIAAGHQAPAAARTAVAALVPSLIDAIVRAAGQLNTHEYAARVTGDPRYAAGKNSKPPRKVG